MPATAEHAVHCPRCAAVVGPDQDWCLECGLAARTRLAPTPPWQLPVAVLATLSALAVLALGVAFVIITGDDEGPATTTPTAPAATTPTTTPPPVPPPAATTPPATTPTTTTTTTPTTTTQPRTTPPPGLTAPGLGSPATGPSQP